MKRSATQTLVGNSITSNPLGGVPIEWRDELQGELLRKYLRPQEGTPTGQRGTQMRHWQMFVQCAFLRRDLE